MRRLNVHERDKTTPTTAWQARQLRERRTTPLFYYFHTQLAVASGLTPAGSTIPTVGPTGFLVCIQRRSPWWLGVVELLHHIEQNECLWEALSTFETIMYDSGFYLLLNSAEVMLIAVRSTLLGEATRVAPHHHEQPSYLGARMYLQYISAFITRASPNRVSYTPYLPHHCQSMNRSSSSMVRTQKVDKHA